MASRKAQTCVSGRRKYLPSRLSGTPISSKRPEEQRAAAMAVLIYAYGSLPDGWEDVEAAADDVFTCIRHGAALMQDAPQVHEVR